MLYVLTKNKNNAKRQTKYFQFNFMSMCMSIYSSFILHYNLPRLHSNKHTNSQLELIETLVFIYIYAYAWVMYTKESQVC